MSQDTGQDGGRALAVGSLKGSAGQFVLKGCEAAARKREGRGCSRGWGGTLKLGGLSGGQKEGLGASKCAW